MAPRMYEWQRECCRGWKLGFILNTHHHQDHVGGNSYLKDAYGCKIYGPAADKARIPLIDETFADGDSFKLGETELRVFDTPGHTRGHITFWAPEAKALFPGDTLFAMGCGRLFEGTPEQMWTSLSKLKDLPPETQVFCAHEYTESNAKCAAHTPVACSVWWYLQHVALCIAFRGLSFGFARKGTAAAGQLVQVGSHSRSRKQQAQRARW